MRIFVHDFVGYPFPAQLSRALAARGHEVTHAFCGTNPTNPGGIAPRSDDPASFELLQIDLNAPLDKRSFIRRWWQESTFGRILPGEMARRRPDVVLSANAPLDVQRPLFRACRRAEIPFVFWLQDVIGVATHRLLRRKLPLVGEIAGRYYTRLEARMLRESSAVVAITEDFRPLLEGWGVPPGRTFTVENWAPLEDFPALDKQNAWAEEQGLAGCFVYLYTGTMGMKHNPALFVHLAQKLQHEPDARVVIVSEGRGADWLREEKARLGLGNLILLPYQPYARMPEVMATADVLVAVLEPDAGVFSVPSKVLAYLCAERPLLLAVPPENLAARIVSGAEAGIVVAPDAVESFVESGLVLYRDPARRARLARGARAYAERTFSIARITDRFEEILRQVAP